MLSKKLLINTERCKSCGYCVVHCPQKALSISDNLNQGGYKHVQVDHDKCIACGICYSVCPDYVFSIVDYDAE